MANSGNQKEKLLHIAKFLMEKTDESNKANATDLIEMLKEHDINAERKSIYSDIEVLSEFGMDIIKDKDGYYLGSRTFELAELKLLVDAVSAAKFISDKKSRELVKKIETLVSEDQAKQLHRQLIVSGKSKSNNEKILYTVDEIYNCIEHDSQISFQYEDWDINKKKVLRHGGDFYKVSPAFLIWDDEYYYMVGYDEHAKEIRHYRVDRIVNAKQEFVARGGRIERRMLKKDDYADTHFGMFSGNKTMVSIKCKKTLINTMIDRFGSDISIRSLDEEYIVVRAEVEISNIFYGWITGLSAVITAPNEEAIKYKDYLDKQLSLIEGE